jgi:hypothetical protein
LWLQPPGSAAGCSHEVDGPLCTLLGDLYGKPVLPSGLLAPYDAAAAADGEGEHDDEESTGLMRWFDAQSEQSVLYVAFGSEALLTLAHVRALALGLELAGVRFLWALRKPVGGERPQLPDGFEGRVAAWAAAGWCASGGCRRCACSRTPRWAPS